MLFEGFDSRTGGRRGGRDPPAPRRPRAAAAAAARLPADLGHVAPGRARPGRAVHRGRGRPARLRPLGKPPSDPDHLAYSKRVMARDMVQVMAALGFGAFAVAGHDRGGRVGYRMALDHPAVVTRLAVLDIVPTHVMWQRMDRELAMATYHWLFLAQPDGLPETLIGADPGWWVRRSCAAGPATRGRSRPRRWRSTCAASPTRPPSTPPARTTGRARPSTTGWTPPTWAGAGSPARCWSSGGTTASPAGPRTRWPAGGPGATTSAARRPRRPLPRRGAPREVLAALEGFFAARVDAVSSG